MLTNKEIFEKFKFWSKYDPVTDRCHFLKMTFYYNESEDAVVATLNEGDKREEGYLDNDVCGKFKFVPLRYLVILLLMSLAVVYNGYMDKRENNIDKIDVMDKFKKYIKYEPKNNKYKFLNLYLEKDTYKNITMFSTSSSDVNLLVSEYKFKHSLLPGKYLITLLYASILVFIINIKRGFM